MLVAGLPQRSLFRGHRNLNNVPIAIHEGIALVTHTIVGSLSTVQHVVACYTVYSINVVVARATEDPVRTTAALQEVTIGTAVELICTGVAVYLVAPEQRLYDIVMSTASDLVALVSASDEVSCGLWGSRLRGGSLWSGSFWGRQRTTR